MAFQIQSQSNQNKQVQMSELTQEQINQKRRQKILARSRKLQASQQPPVFVEPRVGQQVQEQDIPLLKVNDRKFQAQNDDSQDCPGKQQEADAFKRYKQMQRKVQRQQMLCIFAKVLGIIVATIQFYLLAVIKKYEDKYNNQQLSQKTFQMIEQKFIDQLDLIYWACFGIITFTWIWIKYVKGSARNKQKFEIIPGSSVVSLLEQLNKVLQYKVLIKALLGYTFTCILVQLVLNQAIIYLGYSESFFRPNLAEMFNKELTNGNYQQIL